MYLILSILGPLLIDEDKNIIAKSSWGSTEEDKVNNLLKIESGEIPEPLANLIINYRDTIDSLVVEDEKLAQNISAMFSNLRVEVQPGIYIFKKFRENIHEYLNISLEEYRKELYEISLAITRQKVKKAAEKRDLFIAQAINALDDVNKTINLFASRLREWYSLHFPEMDELIEEHEIYAEIVSKIGSRDNFTRDKLSSLGIDEDLINKLSKLARKSMGAEVTDFDLEAIKGVSNNILSLYELRRKLERYIDEAMLEVAPNIRGLVGSLLGARLISLAGGLSKLAILPASTIQVLGAEKALFRALRSGGRPPKHGVIFQYPEIHKSPRWQRGKIARALAAKLAIAARIDAFTGEYKADELKEELEKRIKEIKELYAKPPKRKAEIKKERKGRSFRKRSKKKFRRR